MQTEKMPAAPQVSQKPISGTGQSKSAAETDQKRILAALKAANIIYLGETHDRQADHEAQLAILQSLHAHQPQLTIAMEMFQRPYQGAIDDYLAGKLTEAEFLDRTQYRQRWGFDWALYAPILRFAKANQLPVLAINTPTELTRKVARGGFTSLTDEDFQWIPPLAELKTDDDIYRQSLQQIFDSFHHGHGNSDGFERFFQAQVLWDETMASAIAQYWLANPEQQIVVLAGQGHIQYGHGIPNRVARRLQQQTQQPWQQRSVILTTPETELPPLAGEVAADFFWPSSDTALPPQSDG